ncbi:hypothetical protein ACTA71_007618 [Dictyostelium dimigraforme]
MFFLFKMISGKFNQLSTLEEKGEIQIEFFRCYQFNIVLDNGPLKKLYGCAIKVVFYIQEKVHVQIVLVIFAIPKKCSSDDFDPYTPVFQWFSLLPIHNQLYRLWWKPMPSTVRCNLTKCGYDCKSYVLNIPLHDKVIFLKTPSDTPNSIILPSQVIEISLQESSSNKEKVPPKNQKKKNNMKKMNNMKFNKIWHQNRINYNNSSVKNNSSGNFSNETKKILESIVPMSDYGYNGDKFKSAQVSCLETTKLKFSLKEKLELKVKSNKTINNVGNNNGSSNKDRSNKRIANKVNNNNKVTGIVNNGRTVETM